jgi:hypothetical protein
MYIPVFCIGCRCSVCGCARRGGAGRGARGGATGEPSGGRAQVCTSVRLHAHPFCAARLEQARCRPPHWGRERARFARSAGRRWGDRAPSVAPRLERPARRPGSTRTAGQCAEAPPQRRCKGHCACRVPGTALFHLRAGNPRTSHARGARTQTTPSRGLLRASCLACLRWWGLGQF